MERFVFYKCDLSCTSVVLMQWFGFFTVVAWRKWHFLLLWWCFKFQRLFSNIIVITGWRKPCSATSVPGCVVDATLLGWLQMTWDIQKVRLTRGGTEKWVAIVPSRAVLLKMWLFLYMHVSKIVYLRSVKSIFLVLPGW